MRYVRIRIITTSYTHEPFPIVFAPNAKSFYAPKSKINQFQWMKLPANANTTKSFRRMRFKCVPACCFVTLTSIFSQRRLNNTIPWIKPRHRAFIYSDIHRIHVIAICLRVEYKCTGILRNLIKTINLDDMIHRHVSPSSRTRGIKNT